MCSTVPFLLITIVLMLINHIASWQNLSRAWKREAQWRQICDVKEQTIKLSQETIDLNQETYMALKKADTLSQEIIETQKETIRLIEENNAILHTMVDRHKAEREHYIRHLGRKLGAPPGT